MSYTLYAHSRSPFFLPQIDSNALLISRNAAKPRARAIYIDLSPDTEWIPDIWWLNLDYLCTEVTVQSRQTVCAVS